jgi:uncharacterized protein YoxC
MDTLIHADIFFFVTTIAVVAVALAFIIALIYLIVILRRIRDVAEQVREETILFREDIHGLRDSVQREGFKLKSLFDFGYSFLKRRVGKKSKGEK